MEFPLEITNNEQQQQKKNPRQCPGKKITRQKEYTGIQTFEFQIM